MRHKQDHEDRNRIKGDKNMIGEQQQDQWRHEHDGQTGTELEETHIRSGKTEISPGETRTGTVLMET